MTAASPALCRIHPLQCKPAHVAGPVPPVVPCERDETGLACLPRPPILGEVDPPPLHPRTSGYLCVNSGGPYGCGGVGQSFDPCAQDRHLAPEGVCLIVPANKSYPMDLPLTYEACPGLVISFVITALVSVICP